MPHRLVIPFVLLVASCGEMDAPSHPSFAEGGGTEGTAAGSNDPVPLAGVPAEPMIIREATVEVEVDDCLASLQELRDVASEVEGYITSARDHVDESSGRHTARVVMRVPADRFESVLDDVAELSLEVRSQTITSTDVTEEYVDLDARLAVKRSLEQRYLQILAGAASTTEALEVERALAGVREEIERIEGRRQLLRNRAELSTVTIELNEPVSTFAWVSRAYGMGESLCTALLASGVVLAVGTSPLLLLLGVFLIVVQIRRRRRSLPLAARA